MEDKRIFDVCKLLDLRKKWKKRTVVEKKDAYTIISRGCEDIFSSDDVTHSSEEEIQRLIENLKSSKN